MRDKRKAAEFLSSFRPDKFDGDKVAHKGAARLSVQGEVTEGDAQCRLYQGSRTWQCSYGREKINLSFCEKEERKERERI